MLKKKENQAIMDSIKERMEKAKRIQAQYDDIDSDYNDGNEQFSAEDIIVENKLLIDQVDRILGKAEITEETEPSEDIDILSESLIDQLYSQCSKRKTTGKKGTEINVLFGKPRV
jgi:hypothetical protein